MHVICPHCGAELHFTRKLDSGYCCRCGQLVVNPHYRPPVQKPVPAVVQQATPLPPRRRKRHKNKLPPREVLVPEWPVIRQRILARDQHTCQNCGSQTRLGVHHLDEDIYNNTDENLITLCWPCHRRQHHKRRRK